MRKLAIALFFVFTGTANASCWDRMAEGDNALWVITKSIAAPFICIPSDIINQDYTYTGTDRRQIVTVDTEQGRTTYIVTPSTTGADVLVVNEP